MVEGDTLKGTGREYRRFSRSASRSFTNASYHEKSESVQTTRQRKGGKGEREKEKEEKRDRGEKRKRESSRCHRVSRASSHPVGVCSWTRRFRYQYSKNVLCVSRKRSSRRTVRRSTQTLHTCMPPRRLDENLKLMENSTCCDKTYDLYEYVNS